jgi:O-succinylbenzoic acid--CoA ligase
VDDWLACAARTRPEHPFVIAEGDLWSFARMEERVASLAGGLRLRNVGPGSVVAFEPANDIVSVATLFAIWLAGGVALLLNPRLTEAEATLQIEEAGAHLVIPEDGVVPAGPVAPDRLDPEKLAWIIFTSGSRGRPKGVRLTFGNLEASAAGSATHLGHAADDRWLLNLPMCHVGGASILVRSAREATTVLLERRFDPMRTAALLRAGDATLGSLVAVTLARTLDVRIGRYSGVKAVLVGAGPVPPDLVLRATEEGLPALPTYGMTETASQIATARLEDRQVVALPGAEIRTVDGRIEVRGPMVSPGYLNEPDRDPEGWFPTGDLGEVDERGILTVLGRADDVIVCGGENVFPGEVEAAIRTHPGIVDVVVIGIPDPTWGSEVVAVYEGEAAAGALERHTRYRVAGYKVPRRWIRVDALPRLPVGKPDRKALQAGVVSG